MRSLGLVTRTLSCGLLIAAAALLVARPAAAQTWMQLSPTGGPPSARIANSAAYDPGTDSMIIFGGTQSGCAFTCQTNDTWVLTNEDGGTPAWTQLSPSGTPPAPRFSTTAIYNQGTNSMVIFGGITPVAGCPTETAQNDVWLLSDANGQVGTPAWTQLNPAGTLPHIRRAHTAVYDSANDRMIVFGGLDDCANNLEFNDVWVLTNATGGAPTWMQLTPSGPTPPVRASHSAIYDPTTNEMIVVGGYNPRNAPPNDVLSDTWILSNANGLRGTPTWSQGPALTRNSHTAVYDSSINSMLVFGGCDNTYCNPTPISYVSVLSHANGVGGTPTWSQLPISGTTPGGRASHSAVYSVTTHAMTIFGGTNAYNGPSLNDTWVLTNPNANFAVLNGGNTFTGNQIVNGTVTATSFVGDGSGLTNVAALTAATANNLNCSGCVGNPQLGVNYALGDAQGGNAINALEFGGLPPTAFAPASGDPNYVAKAGDTMTGALNLPTLALPSTTSSATGVVTIGGTPFLHEYTPSNAAGFANTFVGTGAGNFALSTGASTAVGTSALSSLTSGPWNTAIGFQALQSNNVGNSNTAVGSQALLANTAGVSNTALGVNALLYNTTASLNVAVGYRALVYSQTGGQNTAVGSFALASNQTGSNNTAVGSAPGMSGGGALGGNTTGNNNTGIGVNAGLSSNYADANQTGSNNTFIGYNSGPGTSTQLNNATAVGANALVSQSNSMVLGDGTINVGIGTQTPSQTLDVVGNGNFSGALTASSFSGNGTGLTGVTSTGLNCKACIGNTQLGINYAGSASQGGAATSALSANQAANALALGGVASGNYARLDVGNNLSGDQSISGNVTANGNMNAGSLSVAGSLPGTCGSICFTVDSAGHLVGSGATLGNTGPGTALRVAWNSTGGVMASFGGTGDFNIDAPGTPAGRFTVKEGGNTGIGTTSPTQKLEVAGNVKASGAITASSFSGSGAGLTGVTSTGLNCTGCIGNTQLGISYAGSASQGGPATSSLSANVATNSLALGGQPANDYARLDIGNSFSGNQNVAGSVSTSGNVSASGNLSSGGTTTIGGGTPITEHLSKAFNITVPATAPSNCAALQTVTFSGAADGDTIALGVTNALTSDGTLTYFSWVSAANVVSVRICNPRGPTNPVISGSIRVDLWKH